MKTEVNHVHALLLLLTSAILISLHVHGLQEQHHLQLQEEKNPGANFVLQRIWSSSSTIKLTVKLLDYFVARSLQFKYLPPLYPPQPSPSTSPSILFWLGFFPAMVGTGNARMQPAAGSNCAA
ncbi:unnamed protein product [Linum trigynum]|uniref:Uncharacterized protein n=1 Tax=Linum trigynum TaxID=586398 RepID=A0AAV2FB13_9ROSI